MNAIIPIIRAGWFFYCYQSQNPKGRTREPFDGGGDGWICYWFFPASVTDEQALSMAGEEAYPHHAYDCSGEAFTRRADIRRTPFHVLVTQSGGLDI